MPSVGCPTCLYLSCPGTQSSLLDFLGVCMVVVQNRLQEQNGEKTLEKNVAYNKLSDLKELSRRENVEVPFFKKAQRDQVLKTQTFTFNLDLSADNAFVTTIQSRFAPRGASFLARHECHEQKMEPGAAADCHSGLRAHGAADCWSTELFFLYWSFLLVWLIIRKPDAPVVIWSGSFSTCFLSLR